MIIIKISILYFIQFQIRHTDNFPPTGTPASYDYSLFSFVLSRVYLALLTIVFQLTGPDLKYNIDQHSVQCFETVMLPGVVWKYDLNTV